MIWNYRQRDAWWDSLKFNVFLLLCAILCHNDEAVFADSQSSLKESVQQESGISRILTEA